MNCNTSAAFCLLVHLHVFLELDKLSLSHEYTLINNIISYV